MTNDAELARKNIEMAFEFSRYVLSNPGLEDKIPDDAVVLFEVANDPELTAFNRALAQRNKEPHQPLVVVHIQGLAPTRLLEPKVTVAAG